MHKKTLEEHKYYLLNDDVPKNKEWSKVKDELNGIYLKERLLTSWNSILKI